MSKGEVKNPQQDQRVGNKSGQQGREGREDQANKQQDWDDDMEDKE